ncbi:MAG: IS4 family transposase [Chitinophagaceae bacterium]|nr:IS4 family transposase [Chitinophagaceae bacterium]
MPKNTFFTGQPVFSQLLSLIPRSLVHSLSREYNCDRYCKKFTSYDHLVSMLFSAFHHCSSLRELITGLQANVFRLKHLGLKYTPRRSTLADANARRTADFFGALFHRLYRHHYGSLPDSLNKKSIRNRLFIVDSTTITLFSSVMAGMGSYGNNGRKKGGAKAHLLVRAKDQLPCFIYLSEAKENDKLFLPMLALPKGSIVVMDRGYNSYQSFINWTRQKVMWVTRLHPTAVWSVQKQLPVTTDQQQQGVLEDVVILLGNPRKAHINRVQTVRLVRFFDKDNNKEFSFISNNLTMNALTIAGIYKQRWDIELLFKRIKQNFNLQDFLGDNENAIKIQLWCGLIADLLIKTVKDKVDKVRKRKWSFANVAGLIRQHLTTYINLYAFLIHPEKAMLQYCKQPPTPQLKLYLT